MKKPKLFIATPALDGNVRFPYALSLANTKLLLEKRQIENIVHISYSSSLLVAERNYILTLFLQTDCTHILMIDADLGWSPRSVIEFLDWNHDFTVGIYPTKDNGKFCIRPFLNEDGSLKKELHFIDIEYAPAGFMMIKREVIEKMISDNPHLKFEACNEAFPAGYCLFNNELLDGRFWGEDYSFCRLARKSGFKILCDPMVWFDHAGKIGRLADQITDQSPECQSALH